MVKITSKLPENLTFKFNHLFPVSIHGNFMVSRNTTKSLTKVFILFTMVFYSYQQNRKADSAAHFASPREI